MDWNFNLDQAKGQGTVLLAGVNNDGSKWWNQAVLTDEGWLNEDLLPFDFSNCTPKCWMKVEYPF